MEKLENKKGKMIMKNILMARMNCIQLKDQSLLIIIFWVEPWYPKWFNDSIHYLIIFYALAHCYDEIPLQQQWNYTSLKMVRGKKNKNWSCFLIKMFNN